LKLSSDYFEIFSMVVGWQVDQISLDARYRKLQQEFHPDRYASQGDVERRLAVQAASLINQAYETLRSPLKRAQYLLELKKIDASQDSHITHDGVFLMEQIQLREQLSEVRDNADPFAALEQLRIDVEQTFTALQDRFASEYQSDNDSDAFNTVTKMQFSSKLLYEIQQLEADLEDE
jgi:molecular chaperone HscB|tara:strand:- start:1047 stop:1577 length:531 start_codon:yes stop_codon:yes gene_type:complete